MKEKSKNLKKNQNLKKENQKCWEKNRKFEEKSKVLKKKKIKNVQQKWSKKGFFRKKGRKPFTKNCGIWVCTTDDDGCQCWPDVETYLDKWQK